MFVIASKNTLQVLHGGSGVDVKNVTAASCGDADVGVGEELPPFEDGVPVSRCIMETLLG